MKPDDALKFKCPYCESAWGFTIRYLLGDGYINGECNECESSITLNLLALLQLVIGGDDFD